MKFGDIIKSNNWLSIEMVLLKLYPYEKKNISGYEEVFSKLKMLQPKGKDISIVVSWEKDDFDQTDYVNVSGYYNNPKENSDEANISLALEFTPWDEWIGMDIDKNSLKTFNELEIIAHCLYEMTFVGFEEEEIKAELDKINDTAEEIENMTEEERREKLKSWDEIKKEWEDEDLEDMDETGKYVSPVPEKYQWRNWAANDEGITGDELISFIDRQLFPDLANLKSTDKRAQLIRNVFGGNNNYMKSGQLFRQVVNELNKIDFHATKDLQVFGNVYETLLKELQSAGSSGEFYTPRAVVEFMADITDPNLGEKVLDPACGTGGFLTAAIVLPDGSLTGDGIKARIREMLLRNCNLHTIIRLPNSVFKPYASVATNLLFFKKVSSPAEELEDFATKEIWYYEHQLPEGSKGYSMTKPIRLEEFDKEKLTKLKREDKTNGEIEKLEKKLQETEVNIRTAKQTADSIYYGTFDLDYKNTNKDEKDFGDPVKMLEKFRKAEEEMEALQNNILEELKKAME